MTAEEALNLMLDTLDTEKIKLIYDQIKSEAQSGKGHITIERMLLPAEVKTLENDGYTVKVVKDTAYTGHTIISWV